MKTRIVAALVTGTLICILAGCGGNEFKPQTAADEQTKMIKPGQPLMAPPGMPGGDKIGQPSTMPAMGGQPMQPPNTGR